MPLHTPETRASTSLYDLFLAEEWTAFKTSRSYASKGGQRQGFLRYLKKLTYQQDRIPHNVFFCFDCGNPEWVSNTIQASNTRRVCNSCRISNRYVYCEECDFWYRRVNYDSHMRNHTCCDSPTAAKTFQVKNADGVVSNGERFNVTLPAGEISDEGIGEIANIVRNRQYYTLIREEQTNWRLLSNSLAELGNKWQTKQGNYAKRLSSMAYKKYGLKLSSETMSSIGTTASNHSRGVDYIIDLSRDLNRSAGYFANSGSCWWGSYSRSRCLFKTHGGFGMRAMREGDTSPYGRAWVLPLKKVESGALKPTFETLEPDAYVVFNGYGTLANYAPARVLAHMTGMTYRKIRFEFYSMYVNSDSGYLVAPEDIANSYTDGSLILNVPERVDRHSDLYTLETQARERTLVNA